MKFIAKLTVLFFLILTAAGFFVDSLYAANSSFRDKIVGIATFVSGKSYIKRKSKKNRIKINQVLFEKDTIITYKGQVHIQFLDSVLIKLLANTKITIEKGLSIKDTKSGQISVKLQRGRVFNKIVKSRSKFNKDHSYKVISPSFTAGVRGTEFLVSEETTSKTPKGVFVKEGKVEVASPKGAKVSFEKITLTKQEQLLIKTNQIKHSILDRKIKQEMEIIGRLKFISRENYERLIKFKKKNKSLLDKIRKKNQELQKK